MTDAQSPPPPIDDPTPEICNDNPPNNLQVSIDEGSIVAEENALIVQPPAPNDAVPIDLTTNSGRNNMMMMTMMANNESSPDVATITPIDGLSANEIDDNRAAIIMTTTTTEEEDSISVIGGDPTTIVNELQQQHLMMEEADSLSMNSSSMPSTPSGEKMTITTTRGVFQGGRRRGRRFATTTATTLVDGGGGTIGKNFSNFSRALEKRCGTRSLRRLLTDAAADESGCNLDGDVAAAAAENNPPSVSSNNKIAANNEDFYRSLFVSQYEADQFLPAATTATKAITDCKIHTVVGGDDDVTVDDNPLPNAEAPAEENESKICTANNNEGASSSLDDRSLSEFINARLSSMNESYAEARRLASSVRKILAGRHSSSNDDEEAEEMEMEEESDDDWKEKLLQLADTLSKNKLIGRIVNLLEDIYCCTLTAAGNPDEWMMRKQSITRGSSFLRQYFADGICSSPSNDLSLLHWAHTLLLERLPSEICAGYLMILAELNQKAHELVNGVINIDQNANWRVAELLTSFLIEQKKKNFSSELFFQRHAPPRLPKDPILMLVSSNLKAHNDALARGNPRCVWFYKNLFPHLGFCTEVKFTPFKKGMTIASCSDQLCAFLKDKIREVQYYHQNRPVILVGWQTSCLVALKTTLEKSVAAVVCLGFPNLSLSGVRGGNNDYILDVPCSTLFVVGQFASRCSVVELQAMRKKMKSEKTGLIVVGGAGNDLKMSDKKLRSENLCQEAVDRCVLESVGEFLHGILETYEVTPTVTTTTGNNEVENGGGGNALLAIGQQQQLPAKRRRISAYGQLGQNSAADSIVNNSRRSSHSGGVSNLVVVNLSTAMEDNKAAMFLGPAARGDTTKSVGDELLTTTGLDGGGAMGSSRKRQIRKPHLLDL